MMCGVFLYRKRVQDMPYTQPTQSFQRLRDYMEKWRWEDPKTHIMTTGYNVPSGALKAERVPVHLCYVTQSGHLEEGNVVCLKVDLRRHQRLVQFVDSGEIRRVCDYLIVSVDGMRFYTH